MFLVLSLFISFGTRVFLEELKSLIGWFFLERLIVNTCELLKGKDLTLLSVLHGV